MKQLENKIGLVGYGYWGKILHSNLQTIYDDIVIHDPPAGINNENELKECTHVFVSTPATTHKEIVDSLITKNKHVFCEKPLCMRKPNVNCLYSTAKQKGVTLFVDWTFMFNDAVNHIKSLYESGQLGSLRSVSMNRLNSGPERHDVSAKWDLSSHDISILQYIFGEFPDKIHWIEKKRSPKSFQYDTCIGVLEYPSFDAIINSSWVYSNKDRTCIFEFDAGVLIWDDTINSIFLNGAPVEFNSTGSPLMNSIETFLSEPPDQEELTTQITEILEHGE